MKKSIDDAIDKNAQWFEHYFRFGLISKGIVYCLTGIIATLAAIGYSRDSTGKSEIFQFIYEQPFGRILLGVIALGLLGYSLLRFFQCFKDIDNKGGSAKGLAKRFGFFISGLLYLSLGFYAGKLAVTGSQGNGDSRQFMVGKILELPAGQWIIGIIGVIIIGNGLYQMYRGISQKFMKKIQLRAAKFSDLMKKSGIIGYAARGFVLLIIGYLIVHAAMTANPNEAKGTDGAFHFMESQFGGVLMALVAIGLIAYGAFMFVRAKYEQINVD
ncbi:MAG TPA: DUF1206 domain-containing protein [Chryseosolibacter sp.]|nr:DUF1206 domain-containing protein [Chryseosolibacter sp.]